MKKFFIVARDAEAENAKITQNIVRYIEEKGGVCGYGVNPNDDSEGERLQVPEGTECILTIGGDGTLIRAAQNTFGQRIPLIGINCGHLGYLCDLNSENVYDAVDRLMADEYEVEDRMMLSGHIIDANGHKQHGIEALNDIVLASCHGLQVMHVKVYVNGAYLYDYNCDGIIFSTPTGSTAYNLSANGPIVNPNTSVILLTPINPHTLNARSIVLDPGDELVVEVKSRRPGDKEYAEISFDGNHRRTLAEGEKLLVHRAKEKTKMIRLTNASFLERIRTKLQAN
ncbi:MAG: NAD(+)/NADH kinase [Lachnospiraceae bacterium]|nr:NAD(+)/NADH kinase [Lachnospiraceae bacterium]